MFELALYTMFQQAPWPNERPFLVLDSSKQESALHCSTSAFLYRLEPLVVEVPAKAAWSRRSATYTSGVTPYTFTSTYRRLETTARDIDRDGQDVSLVFFETDNYFDAPDGMRATISKGSLSWYELPLPPGRYLVLGRRPFGGNDYFSYQPGKVLENKNGTLVATRGQTPGSLQLWRTPASKSRELAVFAMYPTTRKSAPPVSGLLSSLVKVVNDAKTEEEMFYYARLFLRCWFNPEDNSFEDNRIYDDQVKEAGALANTLAQNTSNLKKRALLLSCAVRLGRDDLWRTAVQTYFSLKLKDTNWAPFPGASSFLYPGPQGIKSNDHGMGRFILEQCSRLPIQDSDCSYVAQLLTSDWQEDMREPAREFVSHMDYSASRPVGSRYTWNVGGAQLERCFKIDTNGMTTDQIVEALNKKLGL